MPRLPENILVGNLLEGPPRTSPRPPNVTAFSDDLSTRVIAQRLARPSHIMMDAMTTASTPLVPFDPVDIHERPTLPVPLPKIDTLSEAFFVVGERDDSHDEDGNDASVALALPPRSRFLPLVATVAALCTALAAASVLVGIR